MQLVDTHAHIHDPQYKFNTEAVLTQAKAAGVTDIICVGTDTRDSRQAIDFAAEHPGCYATIGLHPHDAKIGTTAYQELEKLVNQPGVVAVGECGLDYFYQNSPRVSQQQALRFQIELAQNNHKPLIFHVREAFTDFFEILAEYNDIKGVIHSFSSTSENLKLALDHGLYVAFNGIMTFTKDKAQLAAAKAAPLERMLLETDSPFLTPPPNRGKINQPANVKLVAEFLAKLRGESLTNLAAATTANAKQLFNLK